jgi:hypothetical protein
MDDLTMRESIFSVDLLSRQRTAPHTPSTHANASPGGRGSAWRAMQSPPLSILASNSNEHVHVRAVAILGYN